MYSLTRFYFSNRQIICFISSCNWFMRSTVWTRMFRKTSIITINKDWIENIKFRIKILVKPFSSSDVLVAKLPLIRWIQHFLDIGITRFKIFCGIYPLKMYGISSYHEPMKCTVFVHRPCRRQNFISVRFRDATLSWRAFEITINVLTLKNDRFSK